MVHVLYLQSLIDGILLGGIYAAVGLGLSLAFGVMGVINWAHGELLMLAMLMSYLLVTHLGMDPYLTALVIMPFFFLFGFMLQRFILNKILDFDHDSLGVLLWTAGLGMVIWNVVTMFYSSNALTAVTRYTGKSVWLWDSIMISVPRSISFVIAIVCTFALHFFLQKTNYGRALRATAQNRKVAGIMGINVNLLYCFVFGLSFALVAVGGVLLIPNYFFYAKIGDVYSAKAFIIVVLGGKSNTLGILVGGLLTGVIERLGAVILNESYGLMLTYILFIAILLYKPDGIFGKRAGAA